MGELGRGLDGEAFVGDEGDGLEGGPLEGLLLDDGLVHH